MPKADTKFPAENGSTTTTVMKLRVMSGIVCGLVAGLATGSMISPPAIGMTVGFVIGAAVGAVCGIVIEREEAARVLRTKQLDEIIGIHGESMGAPPGSIPSRDLRRSPDESQALAAWRDEWLTPPPPQTV